MQVKSDAKPQVMILDKPIFSEPPDDSPLKKK